ncbi:aspartate/glutamate racemase family protein [Dactylosporangium sp. NPDC049742]|uniref:aspartate/glutamate racemase family protein n=1 Tax=Dactylosporangium sp. NPDC049742 TaxID=3154737 RepID=UPI00343104AE
MEGVEAVPLRICMISPIHLSEAVTAARAERLRELGGPDLDVDLVGLPPEAPVGLDRPEDIEAATAHITAVAAGLDPARYDVVVPDCVLDPGVEAGADCEIPFLGLLRLIASGLHGLGRPFSAVTRNETIAAELEARLRGYGLAEGFRGTDILNLGVEKVFHGEEWSNALGQVVRERAQAGVTIVLNGCSAVATGPSPWSGSWVVDPTTYAFDLIRARLHNGVRPAG